MFKRTLFALFFVAVINPKDAHCALRLLEDEIREVGRSIAQRESNVRYSKENLSREELQRQDAWTRWDKLYYKKLKEMQDMLAAPTSSTDDELKNTDVKSFEYSVFVHEKKQERRCTQVKTYLALREQMAKTQEQCLYVIANIKQDAPLPKEFAWTRSTLRTNQTRIEAAKTRQLQSDLVRVAALSLFSQATAGLTHPFQSGSDSDKEIARVSPVKTEFDFGAALIAPNLHAID